MRIDFRKALKHDPPNIPAQQIFWCLPVHRRGTLSSNHRSVITQSRYINRIVCGQTMHYMLHHASIDLCHSSILSAGLQCHGILCSHLHIYILPVTLGSYSGYLPVCVLGSNPRCPPINLDRLKPQHPSVLLEASFPRVVSHHPDRRDTQGIIYLSIFHDRSIVSNRCTHRQPAPKHSTHPDRDIITCRTCGLYRARGEGQYGAYQTHSTQVRPFSKNGGLST